MNKTLLRIKRAIFNTIIASGIVHLVVLTLYSVITSSIYKLNAFEIVSLDIFFPQLIWGANTIWISWIVVGLIIAFFYRIDKNKKA